MHNDSRTAVFAAALGVIAGFVASIVAVDRVLLRWGAFAPEIRIGVSFTAVETAWIAALLAVSGVAKAVQQRREQSRTAAGSAVRERLAAFAAGDGRLDEILPLRPAHPALFESAVLELLRVTQGGMRDRVATVARDTGLAEDWRRQARSGGRDRRGRALERLSILHDPADAGVFRGALQSPDRATRMQALRSMVGLDSREEIELAFAAAMKEPLITRALVSRDLQKHSLLLSGRAIPELLREGGPDELVAALDLLVAWNRPIAIEGILDLCRHPEERVRIGALRALAILQPSEALRETVLRALSTGVSEERRAAAAVAAAHNLTDALPALLENVRRQPFAVALASATAICRLGPEARDGLERELALLGATAAAAALEALDAVRTGRSARVGQS